MIIAYSSSASQRGGNIVPGSFSDVALDYYGDICSILDQIQTYPENSANFSKSCSSWFFFHLGAAEQVRNTTILTYFPFIKFFWQVICLHIAQTRSNTGIHVKPCFWSLIGSGHVVFRQFIINVCQKVFFAWMLTFLPKKKVCRVEGKCTIGWLFSVGW